MRSLCLTIALCLACLAAADVSHLPSSYLPPTPRSTPEHAVSMSIEQQELQELPEQVEYMRENEQGVMEAMPSSLLTPPAPLESEQQDGTLSSRYLPPAPQPQAQPQMEQQLSSEPLMMQQPQMEMMMAPEQQPEQPQIAAMRYLPPPAPAASEQPQQLTYQQYQEQMQIQMQIQMQMQEQQQQQQAQTLQEEQMPYYMDVQQQPMAPTDAEAEPEPAHELRSDGYHYKQAAEELRLRH